jgi:transposase
MHSIGELRTEQFDILPHQLRVRVTRRPRYACRACEGAVVVAEAPVQPIDGGMATEALIAHVLISKFCDSLPLYRQSQMLARQGLATDRSTLANRVGRACWWLTPLYDLVVSTALSANKLFAEDTTLPVFDPGHGRTKTGRLWCYAVDDRPWCGPSISIAQLPRISGASDLAKAMRYALRHWPGLIAFLEDGRVEMDTNVVKRAIRPITLARENALFAGSDGGARHWAIAITLIQTAKLNGVEPLAWLTDVLVRIVSGRTRSHELNQLLPWNWLSIETSNSATGEAAMAA